MNYRFIAEHRHEYPNTTMCRVLEVRDKPVASLSGRQYISHFILGDQTRRLSWFYYYLLYFYRLE